MRGRSGLSLAQAAQRLRVNKSTVSRWESGSVPDAELRERLFVLYAAYAEEREALRRCKTLLNPLCAEEHNTVDMCEQRLEELFRDMENLQWFPGDLSFLFIEAQLAQFALHGERAKMVLAKAWTYHADYLDWRNRTSERDRYLSLVMKAIETLYQPDPFWFRSIGREAKRINGKEDARSALRFQRQWRERALHLKTDVCLLRGMACYTHQAGSDEAAEKLFDMSRQAADREGKQRVGTGFKIKIARPASPWEAGR
jgi:transcriptional regulator with XRE-family HTH domain